jgi:hypothetical protein
VAYAPIFKMCEKILKKLKNWGIFPNFKMRPKNFEKFKKILGYCQIFKMCPNFFEKIIINCALCPNFQNVPKH